MHLEAPFWWYRDKGVLGSALSPLGALYGRISGARMAREPLYRSRLPVLCIGNFTAGGGGKTPTAIAVARLLMAVGKRPCFLTRGYGGNIEGSAFVSKGQHAADAGDEPLLLAEVAPVMVSADRAEGARAIEATEVDVIVMDDGFQNPGLFKDLSLIVVDASSGLGNGLVMPAGPLRAPLDSQMPRASALLIIGEGGKAVHLIAAFESAGKPVLKAKIEADCDSRWLGVLPVIGFAGIARPDKFFATLRANGARLIDSRGFPDHHRYTEREACHLLAAADAQKAMLVTTAKDWARLPDERETPLGKLKHRARPFPIVLKFEDEAKVRELLAAATDKQQT
ncbi:MAG: tetraacyldisaccharide 4'-kinase [Methyloceanibacter sp.]